jgi:pimeloyl-ACP methyl ester carboxylesterase
MLKPTLILIALLFTQDLNVRMTEVLRFTGVASPSQKDVARMVELWTKAQAPELPREERRLVFRDMYLLYNQLHGRDLSARPQALDGLTQFVTTIFDGGGRMDLTLPEPRGAMRDNYVHVETRGRGPTTMLLISDLGIDGRKLYESFAARHSATHTMHIVSLPYSGAARPLPWPEQLDYASRPWLSQVERELVALVDQPRMRGVTVIGTQVGGYFAARLALLRPKQIRRAVLVNALVKMPMQSPDNPALPATLADRLTRAKTSAPAPQLWPLAPMPPAAEMRRLIADPASTHPSVRNWMAFAVKDDVLSRAWTFEALSTGFFVPSNVYSQELLTTDLTEQLRDLAVPVLAINSTHDEASPTKTFPAIAQWDEIRKLYPSIPLSVTTISGARAYVSADAPAEFDRALTAAAKLSSDPRATREAPERIRRPSPR